MSFLIFSCETATGGNGGRRARKWPILASYVRFWYASILHACWVSAESGHSLEDLDSDACWSSSATEEYDHAESARMFPSNTKPPALEQRQTGRRPSGFSAPRLLSRRQQNSKGPSTMSQKCQKKTYALNRRTRAQQTSKHRP